MLRIANFAHYFCRFWNWKVDIYVREYEHKVLIIIISKEFQIVKGNVSVIITRIYAWIWCNINTNKAYIRHDTVTKTNICNVRVWWHWKENIAITNYFIKYVWSIKLTINTINGWFKIRFKICIGSSGKYVTGSICAA